MPLTIISRRNITYRENGSGEMTVLLVPGRDQIQVVKDLAGLNNGPTPARDSAAASAAAKQQVMRKQVQLSRVHIGRRFIYGSLPNEISDLRQSVKVWLAEDYAPVQAQAFFYIFSNSVVIHGVREQDDEGFQNWRTAQLAVDDADPLKSIINAISDYALANPVEALTVAVMNKLDLYEKLQAGLAIYNISPVPFSKLKPQPSLKPLYRHHDNTILFLTLALFGIIMLIASGSYMFIAWSNLNRLTADAEAIQQDIDNFKRNRSIGQISDPKAVLQAMSRSLNQQPSAILHAAGEATASLGSVGSVKVVFANSDSDGGAITGLEAGQIGVKVDIGKMIDELLLTQEESAQAISNARPWVREIRRMAPVGDRGELAVILQIDQAPSATVPMPDTHPVEVTAIGQLPIAPSPTNLAPETDASSTTATSETEPATPLLPAAPEGAAQ